MTCCASARSRPARLPSTWLPLSATRRAASWGPLLPRWAQHPGRGCHHRHCRLLPHFKDNVWVQRFFAGVIVGVVAQIATIVLDLGKRQKWTIVSALVCAAALGILFFVHQVSPIWLILGGGLAGIAVEASSPVDRPLRERRHDQFLALFGVFFKIGIFTFGGGQAMIPLLQKDLVVNLAWVPMKEFLDFVAISEITPGPVAINMATFVGYKLRGLTGALVTSLGVILPSFIIILVIATVAHTFRTNRWVSAFLDGLQPVVLALLTYAVYSIARGGIPAWWGYIASLGILLLILKYGKKLNLFLVLLAAGGLGLLMFR